MDRYDVDRYNAIAKYNKEIDDNRTANFIIGAGVLFFFTFMFIWALTWIGVL